MQLHEHCLMPIIAEGITQTYLYNTLSGEILFLKPPIISHLLHLDYTGLCLFIKTGNRKLLLHMRISSCPQVHNVSLLSWWIFEIGDSFLKYFLAHLFKAYFYTWTLETIILWNWTKHAVLPQMGLASCGDPSCSTSTDKSYFI